jgi:hypothetical protein
MPVGKGLTYGDGEWKVAFVLEGVELEDDGTVIDGVHRIEHRSVKSIKQDLHLLREGREAEEWADVDVPSPLSGDDDFLEQGGRPISSEPTNPGGAAELEVSCELVERKDHLDGGRPDRNQAWISGGRSLV